MVNRELCSRTTTKVPCHGSHGQEIVLMETAPAGSSLGDWLRNHRQLPAAAAKHYMYSFRSKI